MYYARQLTPPCPLDVIYAINVCLVSIFPCSMPHTQIGCKLFSIDPLIFVIEMNRNTIAVSVINLVPADSSTENKDFCAAGDSSWKRWASDLLWCVQCNSWGFWWYSMVTLSWNLIFHHNDLQWVDFLSTFGAYMDDRLGAAVLWALTSLVSVAASTLAHPFHQHVWVHPHCSIFHSDCIWLAAPSKAPSMGSHTVAREMMLTSSGPIWRATWMAFHGPQYCWSMANGSGFRENFNVNIMLWDSFLGTLDAVWTWRTLFKLLMVLITGDGEKPLLSYFG